MKAWAIFLHSIRQIFGNFAEALQVSGLLFLGYTALTVLLGSPQRLMMDTAVAPEKAIGALISALFFLVLTLWVAVAWHRFVLLGERPKGYLPRFDGNRIGDYGLRSVLIALVIVAVAIVVLMVATVVMVGLLDETKPARFLTAIAVEVPIFVVLYRLSTSLPGIAIDRPGKFADGWRATVGENRTIIALAIISTLCFAALGLPGDQLEAGTLPALLWDLVVGWLQMMISASILTTLYGHYVQKRPLV